MNRTHLGQRSLMALLSVLFALLLSGVAWGQEATAADPPEYRLGAEDVLEISVLNHADLNRTIAVLPDGTLSFPEVGELKAAGKTPKALALEIQTGLEKNRNRVQVIVTVKEAKAKKVRILGAVKTAGGYEWKRGFRLMDVVALAGGLSARPNRVSGRLVRTGGKVIDLNLAFAANAPGTEANPTLEPDDLILLDEREVTKQVNVLGQVQKPGSYDLSEKTTIPSLLAEAGGATDKASLMKSHVLRGGKQIPLNLLNVTRGLQPDDPVNKFALEPGDVLVVPEIEAKFTVLGQVQKPGQFPFSEKEPITALSALSAAGGQALESDLRGAGIIRTENGKTSVIPINLEALRKGEKKATDLAMLPGDILFVPARNRKSIGLQDFLSPITTILSFGILR